MEAIQTGGGDPFDTAAGRAFLAAARDLEIDRAKLYSLKNATSELSRAVALEWSGPLYEAQIPWLREVLGRLDPEPEVVIDVGCEQGLLTSVIAETLAGAEVRGVDRCEEAIAIAEAEVPGVAFHVWNVRDAWHAEFAAGKVGLIHASRSLLGEAIEPDAEQPSEPLPGAVSASGEWLREARALAGRFGFGTLPGSKLISVERTGPTGAIRWARVLGEHGFELLPELSRLLPSPEPENPDLWLPAMVFEHVDGPGVEVDAGQFLAALASDDAPPEWHHR